MSFAELLNTALMGESSQRPAAVGACLISKQPLDYSRVVLPCGHEFNYEGLFQHMLFCKKVPKSKSAIVCPYCRAKTPHVLPRCQLPDGTMAPSRANINSPMSKTLSEYRCAWVGESGTRCSVSGVLHPGGVHCKQHIAALSRLEKKKERDLQRLTAARERERAKASMARVKQFTRLTKATDALAAKHATLSEKVQSFLESAAVSQDNAAAHGKGKGKGKGNGKSNDASRADRLVRMYHEMQAKHDAINAEWLAFRESNPAPTEDVDPVENTI